MNCIPVTNSIHSIALCETQVLHLRPAAHYAWHIQDHKSYCIHVTDQSKVILGHPVSTYTVATLHLKQQQMVSALHNNSKAWTSLYEDRTCLLSDLAHIRVCYCQAC